MSSPIGKLLSLCIAIGYVVALTIYEGFSPDVLRLAAALILPLALIWFPDALGSLTGYVGRGGYINTESPGFLVSLLGWIFLLGLPLVGLLIR